MAVIIEPEITSVVSLCDSRGMLNPGAVGWSRKPLHDCNVTGRWPRKKKWNYWCVTCENFAFSVTLADIDYIGLAAAYFIDCEKQFMVERVAVTPLGAGIRMPDPVEETVAFSGQKLDFSIDYLPGEIKITFRSPSLDGKKVSADITIAVPPAHETLNVVVPWCDSRFQFTSKQNTLAAEGVVEVGGDTYKLIPGKAFACLDFGRGVWPYETKWNWASTSSWQGKRLVGLNLGGKWTDGTGSTENGVCLDGKLFKISDRAVFTYDKSDFMLPWSIKTAETDDVDLIFTPVYGRKGKINALVLKTDDNQLFGHFSGKVRAGDKKIKLDRAFGWAEEHISLW